MDFAPRSGVSLSFWAFLLKMSFFRIQLHSGDLRKGMIIMLLIAIVIYLYLVLTRYLSLKHNWWTSNWYRI